MKKYSYFTFLYFAVSISVYSCPYCNTNFYNELTGSRSKTLIGKELLTAINNQLSSFNTNSNSLINTEVTDRIKTTPVQKENTKTEFIEIINRDNGLSIPPTSYVPQNTTPDKKVTIELSQGEVYIGNGVMFNGFVTNGGIPGPTIIVDEGDIVEFTVVNKGNIPHGASVHAAYTQTSKYLGKIPAGETRTVLFKATVPGVYMYHCAPGGHAIPMHIIFGQYGMIVVKPKKQYKLEQVLNKKPDVEIYLLQHELYSSGKDAINSQPIYTMFNGELFRYVKNPIKAKPGDYIRIYFLNAGPNLFSTFHIVGIIWDYVYWQGNPDAILPNGQSVNAGPSDSWVIEFRMPPDEGYYTMLTHAVGSADRGAIGLLVCDDSAQTPVTIMSDGPKYTEAEFKDIKSKVTRVVSPFEPGSADVDPPVVYGSETKEVTVKIIGNSFSPKVLHVAPGTKVTWVNEDVFTYMDGEFGGIHNVVSYEGITQPFSSNLLAHTEKFTFEFTEEAEYKYMCTPHPYMKGIIKVDGSSKGSSTGPSKISIGFLSAILFFVVLMLAVMVIDKRKK
jgi:nitrite reductase (NO-forming)